MADELLNECYSVTRETRLCKSLCISAAPNCKLQQFRALSNALARSLYYNAPWPRALLFSVWLPERFSFSPHADRFKFETSTIVRAFKTRKLAFALFIFFSPFVRHRTDTFDFAYCSFNHRGSIAVERVLLAWGFLITIENRNVQLMGVGRVRYRVQCSIQLGTIPSGPTTVLKGVLNRRVVKESHRDAAYKGIPPIPFFLFFFLSSTILAHRSISFQHFSRSLHCALYHAFANDAIY